MKKIYNITEYGAVEGGEVYCTEAIQKAIDAAAQAQGEVLIPAGTYLTASVFLHSNMSLRMEKGAVLLGTTDESAYPLIHTRISGVEMEWPAGVLNVFDAENVHIYGAGIVDGQGEIFWHKFWGEDMKGGMLADYEKKGLRAFLDFDCLRPRNVIVARCKNVKLEDFHSVRSGYWNVHVYYSEQVEIRRLKIYDNYGPSTDGIDIDSCKHVLVEECEVSCNDDAICLKSGRDGDGLRVNRICEDVVVQNCRLRDGHCGITLGSETSGGIRNVILQNIVSERTLFGLRLKSSRQRGGVLEQVTAENLTMIDVMEPIDFEFDWFPAFNYNELPEGQEGGIPERWRALTKPVPEDKALPEAKDIVVRNVTATFSKEDPRSSIAFRIQGNKEKPFRNFRFENMQIQAKEFGVIRNIEDFTFVNVKVTNN